MRLSLITVSYNAAAFIRQCIESVLAQDYPEVEYILIDGASTDGTADIVRSYGDRIAHFVSEPDAGLYDAMNKGLALATGEVVGILNADDFYPHPAVLSRVMAAMQAAHSDTLFGDLVYVRADQPTEVVRYFPGRGFHPEQLRRGLMPPHPTFFVRRHLYAAHGGFDTRYTICADFDLMVRLFHTHAVSYTYLPEVLVHMRTGGSSTRSLRSTFTINREMLQACRRHGIRTSLPRIYGKYFTKIFQLVNKPS